MNLHGAVLVDDRAGSRDLIKYEPLKSYGELCRLESADVVMTGNGPDNTELTVAVEVKSIWDLLSSASTGRLQATQVPAMLEQYDVSWLLYYGGHRVARDGMLEVFKNGRWQTLRLGSRPVPSGYVEALMLDMTTVGVHVHRTYDVAEAVQWLGVLHRWWAKPWEKHHGMHTLDKSRDVSLMPGMTRGTLQKAKVAAALPGVGFERAVAAARHFRSVREMVNADAREWCVVPGIGKVVAKAVTVAVASEEE